jgi:hypothetical protein
MNRLLTIDEDHDRAYARDRMSRYGAYVRARAHRFVDWDEKTITDAEQFAALAFEIGLSPIMAPPYVRSHPRAVNVAAHVDEDGRHAVQVDLAITTPAALTASLPDARRGWQRTYTVASDRPDDWWYEPGDNDMATVITTLTARVPFPAADLLPGASYDDHGNPHVPTAQLAVRTLVDHVNAELGNLADTVLGRCA